MKQGAGRWLGRPMVGVVAVLSSACAADAPVAPEVARAAPAVAQAREGHRFPDLAGCEHLAAPDGSTLVLSAYAAGVQIYTWNGTSWGSSVPSATLYADAGHHAVIGTHFGGPTWRTSSGSTVVAAVADRCTPDAASIPWLTLTATPSGPGVLGKVTLIQRLNTVGGLAPSTPGSTVGEQALVPYTADYLFYRAP